MPTNLLLAPWQPGRSERVQVAHRDVERVKQRAKCRQGVLVGERRILRALYSAHVDRDRDRP
jgi:hypothetical protein